MGVWWRCGTSDGAAYPPPLARFVGAGSLLQRAAAVASDGGSTHGIAELVGQLTPGLVQFLAFLEHAAAVLPGLGGDGHDCVSLGCCCWIVQIANDFNGMRRESVEEEDKGEGEEEGIDIAVVARRATTIYGTSQT